VSALSSVGVKVPNWVESYEVNEYISISIISALIILLCTAFLLGGMNTSAKFTFIFTIFNLVLLFFFIITGSFYVETKNWTPFLPYGIQGNSLPVISIDMWL
jgi:APA family basic amino acid/polyamine antiporter